MLSTLKEALTKTTTFIMDTLRKVFTLVTFFSFGVLIFLFFYFLCTGRPISAICCILAVRAFVELNKAL